MKTLTHFLDTPKRSEISALLKPLPISSTTCDSRRLNNIGRSSLTAFRLLRFLFIVRKSILPETWTAPLTRRDGKITTARREFSFPSPIDVHSQRGNQ